MKTLTTSLFLFATLALGIAGAAAPYEITLLDKFSVGNTELKPGDYKVEILGGKAVFRTEGSKKAIEIPATLGKSDQTFASTVFVSQRSKLKEIDLGGTQDRILFGAPGSN
jgi:hypothetical protein